MINFKEYLAEVTQYKDGGLTIFDIDETLFHTTAKIGVMKDGKKIKDLSNQEFNTYKLKSGESFDFSQFRSSEKFLESKPIDKMIERAKVILSHVQNKPHSKVIVLTARANFDNKDLFLSKFKAHGFNTDDQTKFRIERAGNMTDVDGVAERKAVIIHNYLNTKMYSRVRLFDDSMENLRVFMKLQSQFPGVKFEAYFAKADGSAVKVK